VFTSAFSAAVAELARHCSAGIGTEVQALSSAAPITMHNVPRAIGNELISNLQVVDTGSCSSLGPATVSALRREHGRCSILLQGLCRSVSAPGTCCSRGQARPLTPPRQRRRSIDGPTGRLTGCSIATRQRGRQAAPRSVIRRHVRRRNGGGTGTTKAGGCTPTRRDSRRSHPPEPTASQTNPERSDPSHE